MAILLIDNSVAGHHASYLNGVMKGLTSTEYIICCLPVGSTLQLDADLSCKNITFEYYWLPKKRKDNSLNRFLYDFEIWFIYKKIYNKWKNKIKIQEIFLPYFDPISKPFMLLGSPFKGGALRGIYMRPPVKMYETGCSWWQKYLFFVVMYRILSVNGLKKLYILDVRVESEVSNNKFLLNKGKNRLSLLKDPACSGENIELDDAEAMREYFGIDGKLVLLVFGAISKRKGVYELLDTFLKFENFLEDWVVLMVGQQDTEFEGILNSGRWNILVKKKVILSINSFVEDKDLDIYIRMSDVVWGAYSDHLHMSGVIVRAGMSMKPVICGDGGLIGWYADNAKIGPKINLSSESIKNVLVELTSVEKRLKYGCNGKNEFSGNTWKNFSNKISHE